MLKINWKKREKPAKNVENANTANDYHFYNMTSKDRLIAWGIGFAIGTVVSWAFFANVIFAAICGLVCAVIAPRFYRNYLQKKRLLSLREQFKDLMDSLSTSYSAGKNTPDAFLTSEKDLIAIHGENSDIVEEIRIINGGLRNNINIEVLLSDFAVRSGLEDVQSFADVFEVCNRQGGNLKKIVTDTRDVINEKIEIEMEIDTILASNKNELTIMIIMPVVVVIMLRGLGSGTANANTISNIILKVFCIVLFAVAYYMGRKLTDIKI